MLRYCTYTCTCTCRKVAEAGPFGLRIAHPLPLPSAFPPEAPQKALRTRLPAQRGQLPAPSSQLAALSAPAPKIARSSQLPARGRESKSSGLSRGTVPDVRGRKKVRPGPFNPPSSLSSLSSHLQRIRSYIHTSPHPPTTTYVRTVYRSIRRHPRRRRPASVLPRRRSKIYRSGSHACLCYCRCYCDGAALTDHPQANPRLLSPPTAFPLCLLAACLPAARGPRYDGTCKPQPSTPPSPSPSPSRR